MIFKETWIYQIFGNISNWRYNIKRMSNVSIEARMCFNADKYRMIDSGDGQGETPQRSWGVFLDRHKDLCQKGIILI